MIFTLTPVQLVAVNICAWLLIHLAVPYLVTLMPARRFDPARPGFRIAGWERRGRLYERLFAVRRWKGWLPDGAAWFQKGFPKKSLRSMDAAYLERFARETCRGEAAHWIVFAFAPFFFIWNPPWAGWIMIAYGLAANLPCILVQRYNRARFIALLNKRAR